MVWFNNIQKRFLCLYILFVHRTYILLNYIIFKLCAEGTAHNLINVELSRNFEIIKWTITCPKNCLSRIIRDVLLLVTIEVDNIHIFVHLTKLFRNHEEKMINNSTEKSLPVSCKSEQNMIVSLFFFCLEILLIVFWYWVCLV